MIITSNDNGGWYHNFIPAFITTLDDEILLARLAANDNEYPADATWAWLNDEITF